MVSLTIGRVRISNRVLAIPLSSSFISVSAVSRQSFRRIDSGRRGDQYLFRLHGAGRIVWCWNVSRTFIRFRAQADEAFVVGVYCLSLFKSRCRSRCIVIRTRLLANSLSSKLVGFSLIIALFCADRDMFDRGATTTILESLHALHPIVRPSPSLHLKIPN